MEELILPDFKKVFEEICNEEKPNGFTQRRLSMGAEFYLCVYHPENIPALIVELADSIEFDEEDLKSTDQILVDVNNTSTGGAQATLRLKDMGYLDIFEQLASDIVPKVQNCTSDADAASMLLRRFRTWRVAFKGKRPEGLIKSAQLGLFGELKFFQSLINNGIDRRNAVQAWTGPQYGKQDFQLQGVAVEVKSIVHSEPQKLFINGERQLDDTFFEALIIAHYKIHRQQQSGESLPELVNQIRIDLAEDHLALDLFEDKLLLSKYLDAHQSHYESTGYGVHDVHFYRVQSGFPRIIEAALPIGLGSVRYAIDASACTQYEIEEETVMSWVGQLAPIEKSNSILMETDEIEFKGSTWKPLSPLQQELDERAIEGISKKLNGAVAKTVAGFLNTRGGTLLIGMSDDGEVIGIEQDMDFKELSTLDEYQRNLHQLLVNTIGESIFDKIRIRFESHDDLTLCAVDVRRSPNPHFCYNLEKEPPQRVFYVRLQGETVILDPDQYADYFQEHF